MKFLIKFLVIFFVGISNKANAQGILNGNSLHLNPTTMPSACKDGDLRVDQNETPKVLKICQGNVWNQVSGGGGGFLVGSGIPDDADGDDGMVYLNLTTYDLYGPKAMGAWGSITATFAGTALAQTLTNKAIDADNNTITDIDNNEIKAAAAIDLSKLAALTGSRAAVTDVSGFLTTSAATATEVGYLSGVSGGIQAQLDGKQATGNYITALTGDVTASGPGSATATISGLDVSKLSTGVISNTEFNFLNNVSSALCGIDQSCTLTNKTLSGNTATNLISGSGTFTFNTSGTLTAPNATDTLVGKATTDTLTNKTIDADGTGNSITNIENADIKAAAAIARNKLAAVTASRALVSDGSGFDAVSATTATEIGYVNGVTSNIQAQLDSKGSVTRDSNTNYVKNPSGATNASDVSVSSATITRDTTSGYQIDGIASLQCDSSAQNGYCDFNLNTINAPDDVTGTCAFTGVYKGDATKYKFKIYDGALVERNTSALGTNATDWTPFEVTYPCNLGGLAPLVRLVQTETGNGAAVNVGRLSYGKKDFPSIAQARHLGSIRWAPATSCNWSTSSTSFTNFSADTDCSAPTVTGSAQAPGTKIPAIVFPSIPKGTLQCFANGNFYKSGSTGQAVGYRFSDGSNSANANRMYAAATELITPLISGQIRYSSAQGSTTINIQAVSESASNAANIQTDTTNRELQIDCYHFPADEEMVVRADTQALIVEARGTPTGALNGSASTVWGTEDRDNYSAYNNSTGAFTAPVSQTYCWNGGVAISGTEASDQYISFTPYIDGVAVSGGAGIYRLMAASLSSNFAYVNGCKYLNQNQVLTFRIDTNIGSAAFAADSANYIFITGRGLQNNPIFVGSVTSNSTGAERVERAVIACNGTPSIVSQSGSWISSVTKNTDAGDCTLNIASGVFSGTPVCVPSMLAAGAVYSITVDDTALTSTSQRFQVWLSGSPANANFNVICMGPR